MMIGEFLSYAIPFSLGLLVAIIILSVVGATINWPGLLLGAIIGTILGRMIFR